MNGEVGMELSYLIRYGLWHQVGRFAADSPDLERGETVVVRSHRGTELGEVLIKVEAPPGNVSPPFPAETARVLRAATFDDLDRARRLELERPGRFDLCQRIIRDREEALELIDVEPLLDDRRTVLHYLGPHRLDVAGLLATLQSTCNIDGLFEPVGRDVSDDRETANEDHGSSCGHCGSGGGGCGSGSGCSANSSSAHGGCSDCGIKRVLASRRSACTH
jgi:hypothetical protein